MSNITKLSSAELIPLLEESGATIRSVTEERDKLAAALHQLVQEREVEKVATLMIQKGVTSEPREHVIDMVSKIAQQGKLATVQQSLDFVGPNMTEKFAQLADGSSSSTSTMGPDPLAAFINSL